MRKGLRTTSRYQVSCSRLETLAHARPPRPLIRPNTGKAGATAANFTYAQVAYQSNPDYPNHTKEAYGTYPTPYLVSTYDIRSCIKVERKEIMANTKERLVALGVRHMNTVVGKKGKKGKIPAQPHPPSDEPNELNAPIGTAPQARPPGHTMQAVLPRAEPPAGSEREKGRVKVKFTAASGKVVREEPQMQMARETTEDEVDEPSKGTVTVEASIDIRDFFAAIQNLNPASRVGAVATPAKPAKGRKRSVDSTSPEDVKANVALATFVETPGAEGGDGTDGGKDGKAGAGIEAGVPKKRKLKGGDAGEDGKPKKKKEKKKKKKKPTTTKSKAKGKAKEGDSTVATSTGPAVTTEISPIPSSAAELKKLKVAELKLLATEHNISLPEGGGGKDMLVMLLLSTAEA